MDTDIVECTDGVCIFPHNNNRVVMDIECDEIAFIGDIFQSARLQPAFTPEPVTLCLCIVGRNIGVGANGNGLFQLRCVSYLGHSGQCDSKTR
jgi:hypothetical protein